MISDNINALFETEIAKGLYSEFLRAVNTHSMEQMLAGGVLVGFSGGADSVMLLCALLKYRELHPLKLCAVHINHKIRGAEAERDECFSRELCRNLNVEFISSHFDVPAIAKAESKGLEEVARNVRYSEFSRILQSRNDISCIAVAHNATDNLETVIFNMMRGSGARGLSGIAPVRNNIVRPLIFIPKKDIIEALIKSEIPFVTDSTNLETDYKRNYIRAEILPKLSELAKNPERQAQRLSAALRADNDFIEDCAERFISENKTEKGIPTAALAALPPALLSRAVILMQRAHTSVVPEYTHIEKIRSLLSSKGKERFSLSLPAELSFVSDGEYCRITNNQEASVPYFCIELEEGITPLPGGEEAILLSYENFNKFSSNVYKIAIQQSIPFDIIRGKLYARQRREGDSYTYGKMTRKLKKLFNSRKISPERRSTLPLICDDEGIIFVPGFPVRDCQGNASEKKLYIALLTKIN